MSNKFKYQNTSGSQMMIGKSRSEVKGKQLWDPNNKSQPPPVIHSNQQLVDKRKAKAPDVMKLMEEFGKTSINQNEAPKKIVPRPSTNRNLIMVSSLIYFLLKISSSCLYFLDKKISSYNFIKNKNKYFSSFPLENIFNF